MDVTAAAEPSQALPGHQPRKGGEASSPMAAAPVGAIDGCVAQQRQLQFEVAHYIELLLIELGTMARAADLRHLVYFLDLTRLAASDQPERCRPDR
jgi:hypothetical protein